MIRTGDKQVELHDSLGELWIWNGRCVYHVGAEIEMEKNGEAEHNGYYADTLAEAKRWLD